MHYRMHYFDLILKYRFNYEAICNLWKLFNYKSSVIFIMYIDCSKIDKLKEVKEIVDAAGDNNTLVVVVGELISSSFFS